MKLVSLHIIEYKNLKDLTIDFSTANGRSLIIGTNGSGKSNLIEVLSAIFSACYNQQKTVKPNFKFELVYTFGKGATFPMSFPITFGPQKIIISNLSGELSITVNDNIVKVQDWGSYLPKHTIAVYSGEETRLWEMYYFEHYDDFNKQYIDAKPYKTLKMLYFNKYYWDLFASIFSIHDIEEYKQFLETIKISHVETIKFSFDAKNIKANKNIIAKKILQFINPLNLDEVEISLDDYNSLKEVIEGYEQDILFNMMVLVLYKGFKIITKFEIVCQNGRVIKDLSEGEKKLLLIYGALNLIDGENLILFDEPDAHLHEGRKKEVYELLNQESESQILITSHSPKLIKLFPYSSQTILINENEGIKSISMSGFESVADILDTDISFEDELIIRESRLPLLLVEGKTDKKHLSVAWNKLYPDKTMPFLVVSCNGCNKIKDFLNSVPDRFAKNIIIGLVDNDDAGQKITRGIPKISENIYKLNNDLEQQRIAYIVTLPFVTDDMKKMNYCPIEFLYPQEILQENDMLQKMNIFEAFSVWGKNNGQFYNEKEYQECNNLCFNKVNPDNKNLFAETVEKYETPTFEQFRKVFELIKGLFKFV